MKKKRIPLSQVNAFAKSILMEAEKSAQGGKKGALVFAFVGDLGAGKTTFTQALARILKADTGVKSPTFILMKKYPIKWRDKKNLVHIDAYRFENEEEAIPLNLPTIFSSPENIVVIEWADRIKNLLPKNAHKITFRFIDDKTREVSW